jgi:hypothetical protein
VLLADRHGELTVVGASSDDAREVQLVQSRSAEGPSADCYTSGEPVSCLSVTQAAETWPEFSRVTKEAGFGSVVALPLRLRGEIIGAANLFEVRSGEFAANVLEMGQALLDVATIGILHERSARTRDELAEQLQTALDSRVLIEQAKGVLAERMGVDVTEAFATLRGYARNNGRKIREVARAVIDNDPTVERFAG